MTTSYEWLGFALVLGIGLLALGSVASLPSLRPFGRVLLAGLGLRVVGSLFRYQVIFDFYHGLGDAARYFESGKQIAVQIWSFDFSFIQRAASLRGSLWGTPLMDVVSGFVLSVIGPTVRGEFLVFSLLSYLGLLLMVAAFARARSEIAVGNYLVWLSCWPSLFFWPSSIGKEALLLLATGLVVYGYVGRDERASWPALGAGLFLALVVRPHYAAVLAVSLAAAYWLRAGRQWTPMMIVRALLSAGVATWVMSRALAELGLADADLEGIREFVQYRSQLTEVGGSSIQAAGGQGLLSIPLAFVNILFRPFLWEAHNVLAAVSALEVILFWFLVWKRRRSVVPALRLWRRDRLLRLAVPLAVMYTLLIGLTFGNLGIISRQRVVVFPFLFLLLESIPAPRRATSVSRRAVPASRGAPRATGPLSEAAERRGPP